MEIKGRWEKDSEGFMKFESSELERYYELVVSQYYKIYNNYLEEIDDEEVASDQARSEGCYMASDYKIIEDKEEFATTYATPDYILDIWFDWEPVSQKRIYERGQLRIKSK